MIVHIITVADSIDAATDDIGTAYHEKKSLEDVVAEIKTESGRRYSPAVAEALDDEKLFAEIRRILDIERPAAFYTAYKYAWDLREKV
jgi:HD-GYP domain-containing protein (c-di-GMP phosphodiesterase class II)